MTTLSPKAVRFVDRAVDTLNEPAIIAIWRARDYDVGGGDLPNVVARAALIALQDFERHLRAQLETSTDEDEVSDLSNDLGLIVAIQSDLTKQLGGRAA